MKVSNFFCHTCHHNVASQEVQGKRHKPCGGRVTWRTEDQEVTTTNVQDEDKAVPV